MIPHSPKVLNRRQELIIEYVQTEKTTSAAAIFDFVKTYIPKMSRPTLNRDLQKLVDQQYLIKKGAGRGIHYILSPSFHMHLPIDVEKYFELEVDQRDIQEDFDMTIFERLNELFTIAEVDYLEGLQKRYIQKIKNIPADVLQKEFERLTIELSWKSSHIEGNTYTLLETEQLIKERIEPPGHTKEEAKMILNHKYALDYIRTYEKQFKRISRKHIEEVHRLLIEDLGVSPNLRTTMVGVTGTKYRPLDNVFQIEEAIEKLCEVVNKEKFPPAKAVLLLALISAIQPFVDGNKRTSRLMSNALLVAHEYPPLSYRSINELEYKKALIIFYEQNNIAYLKELFIDQMRFSVETYFV